MKPYEIKIIETAIVLISVLISLKIVQRVIDRFGKKYSYHKTRIKIVRKIILFIALTLLTVIIAFIWGIKASQLATY
ncbi:MAG: hypothetical protein ABF270_07885, partial [Flavobacteriales bacterium]